MTGHIWFRQQDTPILKDKDVNKTKTDFKVKIFLLSYYFLIKMFSYFFNCENKNCDHFIPRELAKAAPLLTFDSTDLARWM